MNTRKMNGKFRTTTLNINFSGNLSFTVVLVRLVFYEFAICELFQKNISKESFKITTRVSNSLVQDQAGRFVEPDLGSQC